MKTLKNKLKKMTIKSQIVEMRIKLIKGEVTYKAVAETFGHKYVSPNKLIT